MEDHGNKGIVLMETRVHLYIHVHVYHASEVSFCKLLLKISSFFYSVSYDNNDECFFNCM